MKRERLTAPLRKKQILDLGLELAVKSSYQQVKKLDLVKKLNISAGLIHFHFKTMAQFKRALMRAAIKQGCIEVIAQGLTMQDKYALKASDELKQKAIDYLTHRAKIN